MPTRYYPALARCFTPRPFRHSPPALPARPAWPTCLADRYRRPSGLDARPPTRPTAPRPGRAAAAGDDQGYVVLEVLDDEVLRDPEPVLVVVVVLLDDGV
jgi:hypothetical protein